MLGGCQIGLGERAGAMLDARSLQSPDFLEALLRLQDTRLDDQRCVLPLLPGAGAAAAPGGPAASSGGRPAGAAGAKVTRRDP